MHCLVHQERRVRRHGGGCADPDLAPLQNTVEAGEAAVSQHRTVQRFCAQAAARKTFRRQLFESEGS